MYLIMYLVMYLIMRPFMRLVTRPRDFLHFQAENRGGRVPFSGVADGQNGREPPDSRMNQKYCSANAD